MKKALNGPHSGLEDECSYFWGNSSCFWGECSELRGDGSGLEGDLGVCNIIPQERKKGININDLVEDEA